MQEPRALIAAREHLARAEALFASSDGFVQLEAGLALLDESIENPAHTTIARNLASTYATKIFGRVQTAIASDRAIPQPTLEHFFKLMLAFDEVDFELPAQARALKIAVVRRLIDLFYEGHPAEIKRKALEQLGEIAKDEDQEEQRTIRRKKAQKVARKK